MYTEQGKEYLEQKYSTDCKSPYEIAEEQSCYPNLVRRALTYHGFKLRDRSSSQKNSLQTGRLQHPTKGKKLSLEHKQSLGNSMANAWKNMSEEKKKALKEKRAKNWAKMTESQKANFFKRANQALRQATEEGSKFEKYLSSSLMAAGFKVITHKEKFIGQEQMHLDILLPHESIVIEIDGPSHFFPIYGEESLQKRIATDNFKNALLLNAGYVVIRIADFMMKRSETTMRQFTTEFINVIKDLSNNPPINVEDRFIELCIGNRENWEYYKENK